MLPKRNETVLPGKRRLSKNWQICIDLGVDVYQLNQSTLFQPREGLVWKKRFSLAGELSIWKKNLPYPLKIRPTPNGEELWKLAVRNSCLNWRRSSSHNLWLFSPALCSSYIPFHSFLYRVTCPDNFLFQQLPYSPSCLNFFWFLIVCRLLCRSARCFHSVRETPKHDTQFVSFMTWIRIK